MIEAPEFQVDSTSTVKEQRKFPRLRLRRYLEFVQKELGLSGQLVNISHGGALILSNRKLPALDDLPLAINFPGLKHAEFSGQIEIAVRPIWQHQATEGPFDQDKLYHVGVKWRHLTDAQKLMIREWQSDYCG